MDFLGMGFRYEVSPSRSLSNCNGFYPGKLKYINHQELEEIQFVCCRKCIYKMKYTPSLELTEYIDHEKSLRA